MHGFSAANIVVCSSSFSRQSSKEVWRTMKNNEEACYEVGYEGATKSMNPPPSVKNCKEMDEAWR